MRILLVYPPDGMLPTVPYTSMPYLAACLRSHGHDVSIRDVNLEVFSILLRQEQLESWYDAVEDRAAALTSGGDREELWRLQRLLAVPRSIFEDVEDAIAVMRDAQRFLRPAEFNRAFDTLRTCQRFALGVNPARFTGGFREPSDVFIDSPGPLPDPPIDAFEPIVQSILSDGPDLVGITVPYSSSAFYGLKLIHRLKRAMPSLPVVAGGAGIEDLDIKARAHPGFFDVLDYIMVGEGETEFPKLADLLEAGEDPAQGRVGNLRWRRPDGTVGMSEATLVRDLNTVPAPDYSLTTSNDYLLPDPVAVFQTSRGCYYGKCTFCSDGFRRSFRMRRPELVVEDMIGIHEATGIRHFQFWDSLAPPKTLKRVAREIKRRGLAFEWMAETKFEKPFLNEQTIRLLAEGGCTFLLFGFESASNKVLSLMDKGNDLHDVDSILANLHKHGIRAGTSWFIGFPGETEREADSTFDFIGDRRDRILFSNYSRTLDIGTDTILYDDPDRFGVEVFETTEGRLDYRYKDGSEHWDRSERDEAFYARGDLHLVKNHVELHYAKVDMKTAYETTGQARMGPLLRHVRPGCLRAVRFRSFEGCTIRTFEEHPFDSARGSFALVHHPVTGHVYELDNEAVSLFGFLETPRSIPEITAGFGRDETHVIELLNSAVNRGLVRVLCSQEQIRWLPEVGLSRAEAAGRAGIRSTVAVSA